MTAVESLLPEQDESWRDRAACHGVPVKWFYPDEDDKDSTLALAVCARCPVMWECREYSMTLPELWPGTFGGLTWKDRLRAHQKRRRAQRGKR